MTTVHQIASWFDHGVQQGATHLIVVCDTFDYGDYPVCVQADQDPREVAAEYDGKNMQKIMEVYNLRLSTLAQLAEHRASHW
jgi:hypothetical protein